MRSFILFRKYLIQIILKIPKSAVMSKILLMLMYMTTSGVFIRVFMLMLLTRNMVSISVLIVMVLLAWCTLNC